MPSGADLEMQRLLKEAGVNPSRAQGYDGALLAQLGNTEDILDSKELRLGGHRVALLGASITASNGDSSLVDNPVGGPNAHGPSTLGITTWANSLMGQSLEIVANVARGGDTSAMILANTPDALAANPDYVIGHDWWINDVSMGVSIETSKSNILSIIAMCNAVNTTVILTDFLPVPPFDTQAKITQHFAMVDWLHSIQKRGFLFVPICDAIVDVSTGKPSAWATYDGAHPSPKGARALGEVFANRIGHLFRKFNSRLPVAWSSLGGSGVMGNPRELVQNPMPYAVLGAGAVYGYGVSGTGTPAVSSVADEEFTNQIWQRITLGTDGYALVDVGLQTLASLSYAGPSGTITLVPGTTKLKLQFEFRVPASSGAGKWISIEGWYQFTPASDVNYALQDTSGVGQDTGFLPSNSKIYTISSPARVIPAGSTAVNCALFINGQAGAVIDIRRVSLAVVD